MVSKWKLRAEELSVEVDAPALRPSEHSFLPRSLSLQLKSVQVAEIYFRGHSCSRGKAAEEPTLPPDP